MPHQNPARMAADEIVSEIKDLRRDIEQDAHRIVELSLSLYSRARRHQLALAGEDEPEDSVPYVVFANSWARMASSLRQGVQRMDRTDRLFGRWVGEAEKPVPTPPVAPDVPSPRTQDAAVEELVELYGGDIVNDALSR